MSYFVESQLLIIQMFHLWTQGGDKCFLKRPVKVADSVWVHMFLLYGKNISNSTVRLIFREQREALCRPRWSSSTEPGPPLHPTPPRTGPHHPTPPNTTQHHPTPPNTTDGFHQCCYDWIRESFCSQAPKVWNQRTVKGTVHIRIKETHFPSYLCSFLSVWTVLSLSFGDVRALANTVEQGGTQKNKSENSPATSFNSR